MKRTGSLFVALVTALALLPAGAAPATSTLEAETTHTLQAPVFEDEHWLLSWAGEISGDVTGHIQWWIDTETWTNWPNIVNNLPPEPISHYTEKVRIYDEPGGTLLLEALSRGQTNMITSTWWANGEVVFADPALFPGLQGGGVREAGSFDFGTAPPSGTSTFRVIAEPLVTGLVLVDAETDQDVGPLRDGTVVNLGTTPMFNIRAETVPGTVGSVGFALVDQDGNAVRYRLDGNGRENFPPYAVGGDWPVGDYLPMTLGVGTYTLTVTPYSGGSLTGTAGPAFTVTFTVAEPFQAVWEGEVLGIVTEPDVIAARCIGPAWAVVSFEGTGNTALLGSFHGVAEHCSYVGPLPDGTIGPDGTYGEGLFTITAANGDLLEGTYTNGVTTAPPPDVGFMDSISFTGGTGRFAAASGEGTESGTVDFSAGFVPGAPFTVTMEGVIAY